MKRIHIERYGSDRYYLKDNIFVLAHVVYVGFGICDWCSIGRGCFNLSTHMEGYEEYNSVNFYLCTFCTDIALFVRSLKFKLNGNKFPV